MRIIDRSSLRASASVHNLLLPVICGWRPTNRRGYCIVYVGIPWNHLDEHVDGTAAAAGSDRFKDGCARQMVKGSRRNLIVCDLTWHGVHEHGFQGRCLFVSVKMILVCIDGQRHVRVQKQMYNYMYNYTTINGCWQKKRDKDNLFMYIYVLILSKQIKFLYCVFFIATGHDELRDDV